MIKIPTLFERDFQDDVMAKPSVVQGCEFVLEGQAKAYGKLDGSCCLYEDKQLYKRRTLSPEDYQDGLPDEWRPAQRRPRDNGKWPGWVPVHPDDPADQYHFEAIEHADYLYNETYELVGPKIQGNPHNHDRHRLISHYTTRLTEAPGDCQVTDYDEIFAWLEAHDRYEGIVWRHPHHDLVSAKIKRTDFGLAWPTEE